MRHQQKIGFGPSPKQDYKVDSPYKNDKPSTQSLESTVRVSLTFYRGITLGIAPHPYGITVNVVRLPRSPYG